MRDKILLIFQFKTDFTDINRPLNLAVNPHLLYTLLVAVYFFTFILKIFVILLGYTKISCIFVE